MQHLNALILLLMLISEREHEYEKEKKIENLIDFLVLIAIVKKNFSLNECTVFRRMRHAF